MVLPTVPRFPDEFDGDDNLYLVHDALRLRLVEDYEPGNTTIKGDGTLEVISRIPPAGQITLTEQCSDIDERAISFYYTTFDPASVVFSGLTLLSEFADVSKPKRVTNITVNVMKDHHNVLKDTLIAIQDFCGVKGTTDALPFGDTLEGRINFLRKIVLQPKAWFTSDTRTGNVPLIVEFKDLSFRLGTDGDAGEIIATWDFGDQTASTVSTYSYISATSLVPDTPVDVLVRDLDQGTIKKVYHEPGLYDVKLTVENDFGSDTVVFEDYINARVKAPNTAIIRFIENTTNQDATPGVPPDGPFTIFPKIRSPINTLIQIEIDSGENPATPGYSFAGEPLDGLGNPIDPIITYTWELGDDLTHPNNSETKASFSVGGIYDLKLRVDTQFMAYRITTYEDSIDIVENKNIWLWIFQSADTVRAYEYGLISETFKLTSSSSLVIDRNESFLDSAPSEAQQKREFRRNTGFAPRGSLPSGQSGVVLLYYASGRAASDPVTDENINIVEFQGFSGTYINRTPIQRQWNWVNLNSNNSSFFIFGDVASHPPSTSFTNQDKVTLSLLDLTPSSVPLTADNYLNSASELVQNPSVYDVGGDTVYGHFSVYRTAWKDSTGYIARNDGVGAFFRIKSFYRTEGTVGNPFINIRKLTDMQGPTKLEGQMTNLSQGVYFINNSGSVSLYNDTTQAWQTGGPGVNSLLYRNLQDPTVPGFDEPTNTLLLASDSDKRAYISFDYSPNAFIAFSEIDLTFRSLLSRPSGEQWIMSVY